VFPLTNKYETYKFDIDDNGGSTTQLFNDIIPKIHAIINECVKNNEPLLVHCQAGISRSAISIITWLMKYKQMSYDEAYQFVKKRRPIIAPNIYFVDYAKHNFIL
jgi:protein-tyrosine phosphatase